MIQKVLDFIFGNYNEKQIKNYRRKLPEINRIELEFQSFSDEKLRKKFAEWREILHENPEKTDELLPEVFAGVKNVARRLCGKSFEVRGKLETWKMIHFDVQLIGGMALHEGKIAEMKTGEGKTLVCTLPVVLHALAGRGVHVVTVNDYLARRDAEWMTPLYEFCGLRVGVIVNETSQEGRRDAYSADITYGTNNEFGFDYLRDNMAQDPDQIVQRDLNFAIVDEVDSILIDEARTPLIISAPAEESTEKYGSAARLVQNLVENEDFNIDLKLKHVALSEKGIKKIETALGVENIFTESGFDEVHHLENALKARVIFERDRDYVVRDGQVIIVDEFTGRLMPGRRFSDGLHQALEAKENVEIQRESRTLATVTFQNYFRLYDRLAGMTGTAETEAEEFAKIYKLDTIVIPTNKICVRKDLPDKIFRNERGKFTALAETVAKLHSKGQPVLVGTISIEKSEAISRLLTEKGIRHEVLNAKQHEREAEIVAGAGRAGAVTIATNMAGRGTDIKLDDDSRASGGLAILGTERHESRRIDNQLRGRAGRQGDPGFSQFFVAMDDELMRRFGGEKMGAIMHRLKIPDDEAIENRFISKSVENAQKKIEGFHFDARKHVVQYDDVMNIHREKMYSLRRKILESDEIFPKIDEFIADFSKNLVESHQISAYRFNDTEICETLRQIHESRDTERLAQNFETATDASTRIEIVQNYLATAWKSKKESVSPEIADKISKQIALRSIDELWLEHIDEMTHLRDRVALAGYAQKDPIMEFKREGFEMFRNLLFRIRQTAIQNLFRIDFDENLHFESADYSHARTNEDEIVATLENTGEFNIKNATATGISQIFASDTPARSIVAEKLGEKYSNTGRNDPCPCGSGKKFKKCHGRGL